MRHKDPARPGLLRGALLGAAGRAALTDNFDACRDLSGRRLRHVNAEQKLAEWAAQAKERELEKVGLKHIRAQEKAALREARAEVCTVPLGPVRTTLAYRLGLSLTCLFCVFLYASSGASHVLNFLLW